MINKTHHTLTLAISLILITVVSSHALAVTYYETNFESGLEPKSSPNVEAGSIWTLPEGFPATYGNNNHFNITSTSVHSGNFSLVFTYEARNGFCNTCGFVSDTHIATGSDGVNYFISNTGRDLSISDNPNTLTKMDDGIKAQPGKFVYNTSNGFSKWEIVSVVNENNVNDRLNLKLINKGINNEDTINGGNNLAVTRHCGVDGIIGIKKGVNDIIRRSDCNVVIMWFQNVALQADGTSIFRRQYIKSELTNKNTRQKLHYLRPAISNPNLSDEVVTFGSLSKGVVQPLVSGLHRHNGPVASYNLDTNTFGNLKFERGIWYYLEEEYKAATIKTADPITGIAIDYNTDGEYRLWMSKSGEEPTQGNPTLEVLNLDLPTIGGSNSTHISFWGNFQHESHARGKWYLDDIRISDAFNGPVPMSGINTSPPLPTSTITQGP